MTPGLICRVSTYCDSASPYCINGDDGTSCYPIDPNGNWPGTITPIENGLYWLYVAATDNDPHQQDTRILSTFEISMPLP
jgi:hypothetical protein